MNVNAIKDYEARFQRDQKCLKDEMERLVADFIAKQLVKNLKTVSWRFFNLFCLYGLWVVSVGRLEVYGEKRRITKIQLSKWVIYEQSS